MDPYIASTSKFVDTQLTLDIYDEADTKKYIQNKTKQLQQKQETKTIEDKKKRAIRKKAESTLLPDTAKAKTIRVEREFVCHIDSRSRDKKSYPLANSFKIYLGRLYRNVTQVSLISSEIPNSDSVIKTNNNVITWINLEDEDLDYPIYQVALRTGYYTTSTLQGELESKMRTLKLRNGTSSQNHYFIVSIDTTSDIVTFVNLKLTALENAPLKTIRGTNIIEITHTGHGYLTGSEVYIVGATSIAGITSSSLNNQKFPITVNGLNTYLIETNLVASDSLEGGGNNVKIGVETRFQFFFGAYSNNPADKLGFPMENSSEYVNELANPLRSKVLPIEAVITGFPTVIFSTDHGLQAGDKVLLIGLISTPSLLLLNTPNEVSILTVLDADSFIIDVTLTQIDLVSLLSATIKTNIFSLTFDRPHGFNRIVDVSNVSTDKLTITTYFDHGLTNGDSVYLRNLNSDPTINGQFTISNVLADSFEVTYIGGISTPGTSGYIGATPFLYLYGVETFDNYDNDVIKWKKLTIRDYVDETTIRFTVENVYMTEEKEFGGLEVKISSNIHGFRGRQTNEIDGSAINLVGENYAYLISPQIGNAETNGEVRGDVLAKIKLNANPGEVVFDSFVTAPTIFDPPLNELSEIQLKIVTYDGTLFDFNKLDYSISLSITQIIDKLENESSQFIK